MNEERIKQLVSKILDANQETIKDDIKDEIEHRFYIKYIDQEIEKTRKQCYAKIDREIASQLEKFCNVLDNELEQLAQTRIEEMRMQMIKMIEDERTNKTS